MRALTAVLALGLIETATASPQQPPDHREAFSDVVAGNSFSIDFDDAITNDSNVVTAYRARVYLGFSESYALRELKRSRKDSGGKTRYVAKGGGVELSTTFTGDTITAFHLKANVRDSAGVRHRISWRLGDAYGDVAGW